MTTFIYAPEFWIGSWAGFVTWTCFMLMWRVARLERQLRQYEMRPR